MSNLEIIRPVEESEVAIICKELGEDVDRLRNRQELFKQWMDREEHIPKNIDQRIIDNFIRLSKFDIERAKRKFEMWLYARTKYSNLYSQQSTDKGMSIHRSIFLSRGLTEDGYRFVLITCKNIDVEHFDYEQLLRYCFMYTEYFLLYDINCGYSLIVDFDGFKAQMVAKISVALLKIAADIVTKVQPQRMNQLHIINLPAVAQGLYVIAVAGIPEKLKKRVVLHKSMTTVLDYIKPNTILPNECGGKDGDMQEFAESTKEFLLNDEKFQGEREKWVLAGELPSEKRKACSFGDYGTAGSFRKLQID